MVAIEATILHWWLDTSPAGVRELWFNVSLDGIPAHHGAAFSTDPSLSPALQRMWQALNAKRADVIARYDEGYQVIELRRTAGPQTAGEIAIYSHLAQEEFPHLPWLDPMVICIYIDPLTKATLENLSVTVVQAPESIDLASPAGQHRLAKLGQAGE